MYRYIVESCEPVSPSAQLITLKLENNQRPLVFQPGQYAAISFYRKGRPTPARCFSIVSSPTEQNTLQFSMRTGGRFTGAAKQLTPGDKVNVRGPFGGFVFEAGEHQKTVFLAGGIGITPFMSMIRYATRLELENEITLLYSCKNQDDAPFAQELMQLSQQNPHFQVVFVIADGSIDKFAHQRRARGRIDTELLSAVLPNLKDRTFFICGPPAFMKGMSTILTKEAVKPSDIFTEAFSQGPNRQTGKIQSWPYNIYSMGAISVVLGSFIVMAADLSKTLPPLTLLKELAGDKDDMATNARSGDLDTAINQLPALPSSAAASSATQPAPTASTTTSNTPSATTTPVSTKVTPACVSTPSAPC